MNNFCERCGTKLEGNVTYCPGCGVQVNNNANQGAQNYNFVNQNNQQQAVDNQGYAMPQQQGQQMNYNQQPNGGNQGFGMPQQQGQQMNYNQQPNGGNQSNIGVSDDGEKILSVFGYLVGIVALIMYFVKPKTVAGKFHITQALNVFILNFGIQIAITAISFMIGIVTGITGLDTLKLLTYPLSLFSWVSSIFFVVIEIMGAVYAGQGQMKELPIVSKFKIFK